MPKFLLSLVIILTLVVLPGCSLFHKKNDKPSAHIYRGDAPTLRFTDRPEKPGGDVNPY